MNIALFPQDIIEEFNLLEKVDQDGNVFCEVRRGMYGLPQAGIIAQELLEERLIVAGYRQSKLTQGSGLTIGGPSVSPLSLTTSESNTSLKTTSLISLTHSRKITTSTQTRTGQDTSD